MLCRVVVGGPRRRTTAWVALGLATVLGAGTWLVTHGPGSSASPRATSAAPLADQAVAPVVLPGRAQTHDLEPASSRPPGRPNVMVVMLDDMRWDEVRFLPNVQRYVRDRGIRFTNAFSPYPLCCPARASFLTGKYAHNHHVLYHDAPYGFGSLDDSRTIATSLRRAGYRTAMVGKYLNKYGVQPSRVTGRSSITYVPAGWTDWMAGLDTIWPTGSPNAGNTYDYFSFTQNVNGSVVPHPGQYSSTVVADEVDGLVRSYARGRRPWFLWVTPVAPHHGGPREADDPAPYTEADGRVQTFVTPARPAWVKGLLDAQVTHAPGTPLHHPAEADVADKPRYVRRVAETTPEEQLRLRDTERQRAESLLAWDREFGRIVQTLKRTGEYGSTVLAVTSDNGYYTGEHRQRLGKIKPHEPAIKVPLLVAGPGVQHGVRQTPVTTFDLTATVLDLAHATLRGTDGESKADVLYGPDRGWTYPMLTEGLVEEIRGPRARWGGLSEVGVRTGRYKYVRYVDGERELYDLLEDPLELHSRIGDPSYATVQRDLDRLWRRYRTCAGASCRTPLPPTYRLTVAQLRREDAQMRASVRRYYD